MNTTDTISTQDVGLGIFVYQVGSSRPEWLHNAGTPESQAIIPQTPHLSQQPNLDGPPPSFSLPIDSVMPNTIDTPNHPHTNGAVENNQLRREAGQYMNVGLGFLCLNNQTNAAFTAMCTPMPS
jgi:hypothetical protein